MSYNVDTWKTKELVDLRIPVASLYKSERKDWHPKQINHGAGLGRVLFQVFNDSSSIGGQIAGDVLHVTHIVAHGEGSGSALRLIIEPALADSTGKLVASRVWEGGDSIDVLTVVDGVLTVEEIDV